MALRYPFMVKENFNAATSSLSIQAKIGESIKIKQLRVGALASGGFCECLIDRLSVGFWYIGGINENHLEQCSEVGVLPNVFQRLQDLGVFDGYPIAEGETFELVPKVAGTTIVGAIVYEVHDAGDMTPDMKNGSQPTIYTFLNYGTNTAQINSGSYGAIDKSRNPSEYPAFPFGDVVPAKHQISIEGILLKDWGGYVDDTANTMRYLKMVKERQVLFTDDRRGIYSTQGMSYFTWGPIRQTNTDIKLFPQPLVFDPGEELQITLSAASNVTAEDVMLATIQNVTRVE